MKKQILHLGRKLSRTEQQKINGGSGCAYYNGETGEVTYGMSSSGAQASLSNPSDHWCCNSCGSASWYNPSSGPSHGANSGVINEVSF
jgi:hypothetical protein